MDERKDEFDECCGTAEVTEDEAAAAAEDGDEVTDERPMSAEDYIAEIQLLREQLDCAIAEREQRERELECITALRNAGLPEILSGFVMKAGDDAAEVVNTIRSVLTTPLSESSATGAALPRPRRAVAAR